MRIVGGLILMPYLICDNCGTYYSIEDDEEIFEICDCGSKLRYYETLLEYSEYARSQEPEPVRKFITLRRAYTENKAYDYRLIEIIGVSMGIIGFIWLINGFLLAILSVFAGIIILIYGICEGYSWKKGLEGEKIVNDELEKLPEGYFIFYDVKLPGDTGNIDHVVIGSNGIFVVETKSYEGEYLIKGDEWYLKEGSILNPKWKKVTRRPGKQAKANALALRNFLIKNIGTKRPWVHAIVALVGQRPLKIKTEYYTILQPQEIPEFITNKKGRLTKNFKEESIELIGPYSAEISFM